MKPRMSIRAIEKMYGVGQEKAKVIQSTYYERAFNGRPPAEISQEELDYVLNYRTNFNVGYQRLYKVAQRDPNFNPPQKLLNITLEKSMSLMIFI